MAHGNGEGWKSINMQRQNHPSPKRGKLLEVQKGATAIRIMSWDIMLCLDSALQLRSSLPLSNPLKYRIPPLKWRKIGILTTVPETEAVQPFLTSLILRPYPFLPSQCGAGGRGWKPTPGCVRLRHLSGGAVFLLGLCCSRPELKIDFFQRKLLLGGPTKVIYIIAPQLQD